jgi:hypothetical protein
MFHTGGMPVEAVRPYGVVVAFGVAKVGVGKVQSGKVGSVENRVLEDGSAQHGRPSCRRRGSWCGEAKPW